MEHSPLLETYSQRNTALLDDMKKLFGRDKDKPRAAARGIEDSTPASTPIHQQHAVYREHDDERWEVVEGGGELANPRVAGLTPSRTSSLTSLPPGAGPPIPSPRSPSPFKQPHAPPPPPPPANQLKKKPPVPGTILRALEPHSAELVAHHRKDSSDVAHRDPKKGFWAKDTTRDRDKDPHFEFWRDVGEDGMPSLTRQIGYLTATSSENWPMVLEVCERSSANEANAKEAVRALRREFKYGEPTAQLSAARLWAVMLRNSTETFIGQSTSRKFLDTLEDILLSPRTSPVVRERIMDVVAAAAYASGTKKDTGFRGLWRKIKPADRPEEGIPFDTDDAMFCPPVTNHRLSYYEPSVQQLLAQDPPTRNNPPPSNNHHHKKRKSPTRNRIIPPEEDIKRLFQECKIGQGNASLLSQALVLAKPEDLKTKNVIQEFYLKCRQSQEIIFAQIPWATSGAERSRIVKDEKRKRTHSNASVNVLSHGDDVREMTVEENLLAALLAANAEIIEALKQYDDLERVGIEREAEEMSRRDVRMDPRERQLLEEKYQLGDPHVGIGGSSSRSPSPAPRSRPSSVYNSQPSLAPPAAPHGPRPAGMRTPSPGATHHNYMPITNDRDDHNLDYELDTRFRRDEDPMVPSAKALGKRRVVEAEVEEQPFDSNDLFYEKDEFPPDERPDYSDSEDSRETRWQHSAPAINFVYDAAAERTKQRLQEGHKLNGSENLVH